MPSSNCFWAPTHGRRGHQRLEPHTQSPQQKKQRWNPARPMKATWHPHGRGNGWRTQQNETKRQDRLPAAFRPSAFCRPLHPCGQRGLEYGLPAGSGQSPDPTPTMASPQHAPAPQDLMCDFSTLRPFSFHNSEAAVASRTRVLSTPLQPNGPAKGTFSRSKYHTSCLLLLPRGAPKPLLPQHLPQQPLPSNKTIPLEPPGFPSLPFSTTQPPWSPLSLLSW